MGNFLNLVFVVLFGGCIFWFLYVLCIIIKICDDKLILFYFILINVFGIVVLLNISIV